MITNKLLVAYIDGWDRRFLDHERAPFMEAQFHENPWATVSGPASVDLLPSILTGARPDQHGMFGVKLRQDWHGTWVSRLVDLLPDVLTTSIQCGLFALTGQFDLACVPPRRRRRFEIHRSKIPRSQRGLSVLLEIGGCTTCLGAVGPTGARYIYSTASDPVGGHLDDVGSGSYELEFLQLYTMDLVMRWNYGHERTVMKYSRRVDEFIRRLAAKCRDTGVTLVVMSDHGYDATAGTVNLVQAVRELGLPPDEYTMFVEITSARFWFHSERARHEIPEGLAKIEHLSVHEPRDFRPWGVELTGEEYGELFCLSETGWILFPNDFHNTVGNWALGFKDPKQRRRFTSPKHRGNHGLRPGHPAATGFIMVFDNRYRVLRRSTKIEDIAPSILAMLGRPSPSSMFGTPIFERIAD